MAAPFFSVVIPTYNRSELFPLAVRSILQQTFENFEIIVSDNCSVDNTPEVARQFTDPRVQYVRTPQHYTISDAWEFARRHAKGELTLMLSDDDALVGTALECFRQESERHDANFLFSRVAEYRDQSFPGPDRNSVDCPRFSGVSRRVTVEEFVRPLYEFRPKFNMHPSAFAFAKSVADLVARRTGRFFWTNGVEYSAWPITALFAKGIVCVDLPLTICGRTGKSWGSNITLCNPGEEQIEKLLKDVDHKRNHAPLNNFTLVNLMAEGMLTAKSLFPREFADYEFDEVNYIRKTMAELRRRRSIGVNVSAEIADAMRYAEKYPALIEDLNVAEAAKPAADKNVFMRRLRSTIGDLGGRVVRRRIRASQLAQKLEEGTLDSRFQAFGDDFDFGDILGCAEFLTSKVIRANYKAPEYDTSVPAGPTGERRPALGEHD
jgi:glycosyltransferase involved in cell wall biosynthesis